MLNDDLTQFQTAISASAPEDLAKTLKLYWQEIRGAQRLPARTSVDPRRIDETLPHAFIVERVAPGIARFRVCGQRIADLAGCDTRGMPMSVLFSIRGRETLCDYLEQVFAGPAIVELPLVSPRSLTRAKLTGQMLLLPLESADGTANRALGAMFVEGFAGRAGRQFDIPDAGARTCEIVAPAALPPDMQRPAPMRPALRLVVSNP